MFMAGVWREEATDMEPRTSIAFDAFPEFRVYADGSVERFPDKDEVPPEHSPRAKVASKDVILDDNRGIYVRIYLPRLALTDKETHRLPIVVYIHGGGFCVKSPATALYHNYVNVLAKEANIICVSVNYRKALEHRLPATYDDCFTVLEWLDTRSDPWIESRADLATCFVTGDSAGGNIVHHVGTWEKKWRRLSVVGAVVVHASFGVEEMIGSEGNPEKEGLRKWCDNRWKMVLPEGANKDHPFCNPLAPGSGSLSALVYSRILVFVAENDIFKDRSVCYYEALKKEGKDAELIETEGEDHGFHLLNPQSEKVQIMMKQICQFIHSSSPSSLK